MAFMWERERISNEDVLNCAADYMEHISRTITASSSKTPNSSSSSKAPLVPSSSSSSLSSSSSSSASPTTSSSSSGWNWFSWFAYPSASSLDNSAASPSINSSSNSTASEQAYQSYGSWLTSWFTWSTPTDAALRTENENIDGNGRQHDVCQPIPAQEEAHVVLSVEQQRQEEYRRIAQYARAQLEESAAQMPLVGMVPRKGWRDMNVGPRLIEHALGRTKTEASKLWKKKAASALAVLGKRTPEVGKDSHMLRSSITDLACIGGGANFYEPSSVPTEDLYKLYMQVDWDGGTTTGLQNRPTKAKEISMVWDKIRSHLQNLDLQLADCQGGIRSYLGYFQEELLFEGLYGSPGPVTDCVVKETVKTAVEKGAEFCSNTIASFPSKVRLKRDIYSRRFGSKGTPDFSLKLEGLDLCVSCDGRISEKKPTKLVVLTEEMARTLYVASSMISIHASPRDHSSSDPLCGWECINKDSNYMAYRKLYKDTGLYQYKVIGQYGDITAKDFLDVQVNHNVRKDWDAYAGDLVVMETDQVTNCKLIHWIMKYPFPMSHREYLFVQRLWTSDSNDLIVIMNRASSHPAVEDSRRYVKVSDYFSDMVIQAHSTVDKPGMNFELTYFDNPKSNLPSSCVNWVTYSALPDFMSKVHAAAVAHHEVLVNL